MTDHPPPDWRGRTTLTVEEAAVILGVGRSSAYNAVKANEIPSIRVGGKILVLVAPLREMLGEVASVDEQAAAAERAAAAFTEMSARLRQRGSAER